jgi:hypothetical protein
VAEEHYMSYDINFWKQERPLELSAQEIYQRLSKGESVDGLATLAVDRILAQLREAFPDFDPEEEFPLVSLDDGSIEFIWSDQYFRFDFRGEVGATHQNRLVRIMSDHGCPMYDPQVNKRYDADGGTKLGEFYRFEDPTPEQKAEIERLKQQFMAKLEGQGQPKGCRGSAVILALGALAVIVLSVALVA